MISSEKLSIFNIDIFRKLYNTDYRSYVCDKDFFTIYDEESFIVKYLLRRQVRLFKINNNYVGYIWCDISNAGEYGSIYALYIIDEYIKLFESKLFDFVKCSSLRFDARENENITHIMEKLGFEIKSRSYLMKLESPSELNEISDEVEFKHFVKNRDEALRCRIQNSIFFSKDRTPLNPDDIFEEENQDYYINEFSVFLCVNNKYAGYGQIILSNGLYTIVNFGIIEEYRCQGYGQNLLDYLIELCRINSINDIYIRVEKDNYKAVSLYKKIGFKEHGLYNTWYKCIV
ncbi:MAG: GNAT family N-acetyltransferase [Clostridium sp.]